MRKSLRDLQRLEAFIQGQLDADEAGAIQTELLLHPQLYQDWLAQQEAYALIRAAGRRQLKAELRAIHLDLQQDGGKREWWEQIRSFFTGVV